MFLVVLAVAWIVVLVPPVLRARSESRNHGDSIGDFQNRLGVLSRSHSSRQFRRAPRASRPSRADMSPMPGPASALGARRAAIGNAASSGVANRPARPSTNGPRPGPMAPVRNPGAERSARRRREVVTVLFAATTLSAAVASALGGTAVWALQILTDLALLTYVLACCGSAGTVPLGRATCTTCRRCVPGRRPPTRCVARPLRNA